MQAVTLDPAGTYSHRTASAVADDVAFRESVGPLRTVCSS